MKFIHFKLLVLLDFLSDESLSQLIILVKVLNFKYFLSLINSPNLLYIVLMNNFRIKLILNYLNVVLKKFKYSFILFFIFYLKQI